VKRAELAEDRRMRNKSRKSAIATYMKKVRWAFHDALNAGSLSEPSQCLLQSYYVAAAAVWNLQLC
jgi:ribosomal protein S20